MRYLLLFLLLFSQVHSARAPLPPSYVWGLGFSLAADVHPKFAPFGPRVKVMEDRIIFKAQDYIEEITDGSIVWVPADKLLKFTKEVIPEIGSKIIIVSGGTDATFPDDYEESEQIIDLIDCSKVIHIFLQNCAYTHPKVTQLPIGIDLHTMIHWPKSYGEPQAMSPRRQLRKLEKIVQSLPATGDRKRQAICDFGNNDSMHGLYNRYLQFGEDRTSIRKKIEQMDFATHLKERVSRTDLWKIKGQCAFDVSPPGNGLDCHRTWESLILGCIVIVKDSCLNPMFDGLPVVIVKSWDEITNEKLIEWQNQYSDALTNPKYREKLLSTYWVNKMRAIQSQYQLSKFVKKGFWGHGKTSTGSLKGIEKNLKTAL